jgi:hypothetical protein
MMISMACIWILVLSGGRVRAEDKTFSVDDDGFIRNWLGLPGIALNADMGAHSEDVQKACFDKEYFTNQKTAQPKDNDKVTVDGKDMNWKATQLDGSIWTFESVENAIYLIATYIVCDQEVSGAILSIGSDDSSMWLLNGKEVIRFYGGRGVDKDQSKSEAVTLKKGVNILWGVVINGTGPAGACARFLDKDGNPVKNIKVSVTPPAAAPAAAAPAAPAPAAPAPVEEKK